MTTKRTVPQSVFNAASKYAGFNQAFVQAEKEIESAHALGLFDDGDPNHPKYNNGYNYATGKYVSLFGYDQDEFMSRQYK